MTLSSWALDNKRLKLELDGPNDFVFSIFSESNEWLLVDSSAWNHIESYKCGHTETLEFTQLTYSLTIRRRVGFYVYALIIPSVLLSLLMPLTFWIPTSGDGRITLGNYHRLRKFVNPLTSTVTIRVAIQLWQHPLPDQVKPSFVIVDIRAL